MSFIKRWHIYIQMKQINNKITDTILDYYNRFKDISEESDPMLLGLKEVMISEYTSLLKHIPLSSLSDFRELLKEYLFVALEDYNEVIELNLEIEDLSPKDYFTIQLCTLEIQNMGVFIETIGDSPEYYIAEMFDMPKKYIEIFRSITESFKESQ